MPGRLIIAMLNWIKYDIIMWNKLCCLFNNIITGFNRSFIAITLEAMTKWENPVYTLVILYAYIYLYAAMHFAMNTAEVRGPFRKILMISVQLPVIKLGVGNQNKWVKSNKSWEIMLSPSQTSVHRNLSKMVTSLGRCNFPAVHPHVHFWKNGNEVTSLINFARERNEITADWVALLYLQPASICISLKAVNGFYPLVSL